MLIWIFYAIKKKQVSLWKLLDTHLSATRNKKSGVLFGRQRIVPHRWSRLVFQHVQLLFHLFQLVCHQIYQSKHGILDLIHIWNFTFKKHFYRFLWNLTFLFYYLRGHHLFIFLTILKQLYGLVTKQPFLSLSTLSIQ